MNELFDQILSAATSGAYYLALFGALTVPDICSGLEAEDGFTSGLQYQAWFSKWVTPRYLVGGRVTLTGQDAYQFRCSMLHQGTTQHPTSRYRRILFVPRSNHGNVFHNNVLDDALNLDIPIFCKDIVDGARMWQQEVMDSETYQRNFDRFVRIHPMGIGPYMVGTPVVS